MIYTMYININKVISYVRLLKRIPYILLYYLCNMIENLNLMIYAAAGFAISYLSLEAIWHMMACRISDQTIKPCLFKGCKKCSIEQNIIRCNEKGDVHNAIDDEK